MTVREESQDSGNTLLDKGIRLKVGNPFHDTYGSA